MGVFLLVRDVGQSQFGLPHVRGGVSYENVTVTTRTGSSPRTWGVSYSDKVGKEVYGSSSRTRGRAWMNVLFNLAFPTRMGCFSFIRIARSAFC